MKAIRLEGTALVEREVPAPQHGAEKILVRVYAAGVTPTELGWYPTTHTKDGGERRDAIPGHEFSGVIEAVGADVAGFRVGEEVFGMNDWFAEGATAQFCVTTRQSIAQKPARLTHAEAASVPIGALTAWQGLLEHAEVNPGERVLVHGGAGAVGVFAIQIARRAGAQVFTTASERSRDFLEDLGADHVIDYHTERFEDKVRDLDVIFDCVGGETLRRSWPLLNARGRMVTVSAVDETQQDERTKAAFFIVEPNHEQLTEIAYLLDQGKLKTYVDAVVPLSEAAEAYAGKTTRQHGRGKVVIDVTA